jgi:SAM-dependent methyltransferase
MPQLLPVGRYINLFKKLGELGAYQFTGPLSGSQYLGAYELVSRLLPKAGAALDWGTGSGHFSLFLLENGFHVTGFTIEDQCELADYMSKSYPDRYRLITDASANRTVPAENEQFELVASIGVLEHVRETGGDEIASLNEIWRMLKPGGLFLCYHFPNKYSWIESITRHLKNKHNHPYKYSRSDIRRFLSQTEFDLVETGRYGLFPRLMFRRLGSSPAAVNRFNKTDRFFSRIMNLFCQNHCFVARKRVSA